MRIQNYAFAFSQGLIVAESLTAVVKLCVPRQRPDETSRYAFPSSHAAGAFALAAVSAHYYGAKAGVPLYALASLVALSRVTYGKHFPSDVMFGGHHRLPRRGRGHRRDRSRDAHAERKGRRRRSAPAASASHCASDRADALAC